LSERGIPAVQATLAALETVLLELLGIHAQDHGLVGGGRVLLGAVRADLPHQSLSQDAHHRGGDQELGHAQVQEARDGGGRVVGVERGEHEVARECGLHGVVGGLGVPDLPTMMMSGSCAARCAACCEGQSI
jgi:hypothetical protein